ncbi:hypothetical protein SDC9_40516 [bioreactor metagenome]|uniref:Uncharacterized protein n=1 Tax=bioreactor metagenome TaxID=1076179 RepID=A0A644VVI0_9ZZZZ
MRPGGGAAPAPPRYFRQDERERALRSGRPWFFLVEILRGRGGRAPGLSSAEGDEGVALLAGAQLHRLGEVGGVEHPACIDAGLVVDLQPALGNQPLAVLAGLRQSGAQHELGQADAVGDLGGAQRQRRQILAHAALLEDLARRRLGRGGRLGAMEQRRHLVREDDLRAVDLGPAERAEPLAFLDRQLGIELEEAPDIGVGGVAPELPELVRREHLVIEPDRAALRLAHLAPVRGGQQRRRQAEDLAVEHPARQVDAVDDVAPLVRAAHLQQTAITAVQLEEVIGLQDHVVEFEEAQRLLAIESRLHRLERQHPVHREVPADVAQEVEVVQVVKPLGVVAHHRAVRLIAVIEVAREDALHAGDVLIDLLGRQQRPLFRAEGGVAHLGGAAAHQRDRLVAGLLEPAQQHDVEQMAHMQRRRGGVIADIGGDHPLRQCRVEFLKVGAIRQEATLDDDAEEVRSGMVGHRACPYSTRPAVYPAGSQRGSHVEAGAGLGGGNDVGNLA